MYFPSASDFLPVSCEIEEATFATKLDRIVVVQIRDANERQFRIRLEGQKQRIDLALTPPRDGGVVGWMQFTTSPATSWDAIFSVREEGHGRCLANVSVFVQQTGLDRWTLVRSSLDGRLHGFLSWIDSILNRLKQADAFWLGSSQCSEFESSSRQALFPNGPDLRESVTSCLGVNRNLLEKHDNEYKDYSSWRNRYKDEFGSDEVDNLRFLQMLKYIILENQTKQFLLREIA